MADGNHAGGGGDDDHRQHQQETAECELTDRQRERSCHWRSRRRFRGHVNEARLQTGVIYDVFRTMGNILKMMEKPAKLPDWTASASSSAFLGHPLPGPPILEPNALTINRRRLSPR